MTAAAGRQVIRGPWVGHGWATGNVQKNFWPSSAASLRAHGLCWKGEFGITRLLHGPWEAHVSRWFWCGWRGSNLRRV